VNVSETDLLVYMSVCLPFCLWNQSTKCPPNTTIFFKTTHAGCDTLLHIYL